jgi:hypothetical protein
LGQGAIPAAGARPGEDAPEGARKAAFITASSLPVSQSSARVCAGVKRALVVGALTLVMTTPAEAAPHGCKLRGGSVLKQTRAAVLLVRHQLVYGCLRSKGAIYRLSHVQEPRVVTRIFSTRLRGRYVAYGELYYGPAGGDDIVLIRVRDLVSGRVIHSAQNGLSSQAQQIGSMVLKASGSVAWTTRDYVDWYPPRPEEKQVLALDGRSTDKLVRPRLLGRGAGVDLRSLRGGSGRLVRWRDGAATRTAELRR